MISGNGQVVATQAVSNNALVVQAKDAFGRPVPNVAITWSITQGAGTITGATTASDANGQASANFLSTSLQPGASFTPATVTANSAYGSVNFIITTVFTTALQPDISVELDSPPPGGSNLTAPTGSTIAAGVVVRVFATGGAFAGSPIPNIGVQLVDAANPSTPAAAACAGLTGVVLTGNAGRATCDVAVNGAPGTAQLRAFVGGIQSTPGFTLTITPGQACQYSLSAISQAFGASGGAGTVNVSTSSGCGWNAISNAGFITITSPSGGSGIGNGVVSYSVAPNSGAGRAATLSIAGLTYTINQTGGSPGSLTIPPQNLPPGALGASYHVTLQASGGTPPYTWAPAGPISTSGLSLLASGDVNGAPATAGTFSFIAFVTDSAGASQAQTFSITINVAPSSEFTITNSSFPNGAAGQVYPPQLLGTSGGCVTPFQPQATFTVSDGALPDGLSIQTNTDGTHSIAGTPSTPGTFNFTLTAMDCAAKTAMASFTITIAGSAVAPQMQVSPASLTFTVQYGAANAPSDQTLSISLTSGSLGYLVTVQNPPGADWLAAKSPVTGNTPGSFTVGVTDFSSLLPGDYNSSVTIASQASNSPVIVPVKLAVLPAATLTVNPSSFTINQIAGSASIARQDISIASGTTSLPFLASATTNRGGQWLAVSAPQGNTPTTLTAIINSAGLPLGQYTGTITIIPAAGATLTVTVTLNVLSNATLSATPAPLSFSYQQGDNLPAPQTVVVSSGIPVSVSVLAGTQSGGNWLFVSPPNGATNLNLSVSVNPAALLPGSYSGSIIITPSDSTVAPLTIAVTLAVTRAGPAINAITNAASYAPGAVAPGEIVTIFGSQIGPSKLVTLHLTDAGTLDTNLGGTQVFFDGYPAPLIYSSATQVSAIVPYEIAGSLTTSLLVQYQGTRSDTMTLPVLAALPGIFTVNASGTGQGAILNQDSTINSRQNGAEPGSVISIFATGGGQTDPPSADGSLATDARPTHLPVTVQIAGKNAEVTYFGSAPSEPSGVLQVNAKIPADVPRGTDVPVAITVGTVASQAGVTLAIQP